MKRLFFFFIILIFLIFSCLIPGPVLSQEHKPTTIRIAVIKDADYIVLAVKGKYKILSLYTQDILSEAKRLRMTKVTPTASGLFIGKTPYKIFGIKIEPLKDATILINNRRFRGSVDIIRTKDLKLLVVNHVDIESYLYGVLYHEVSHRWTMDALKVQAIVSRTFGLYQHRVRKNEDYDVTSDIYSQVYGGRTSEKWRTTRAVNLTKGKVLTFKGDIFPTYYHATCGGHTLDASRLWNIKLKPLKGVKCDYCRESPHYRWQRTMSLRKIEEELQKNGYNISGLSSIDIDKRDESDRAINVILKNGYSQIEIPANRFRLIMGPNIIRSTNFEITPEVESLRFDGLGWGHGVGLCQWGSYFMSKKGYKFDEILRFYYPDTEIKPLTELRN